MFRLTSPLGEFKDIELDSSIISGAKDLTINKVGEITKAGLAN